MTTDRDQLREQVVETLGALGIPDGGLYRAECEQTADAVLAVPAVADALTSAASPVRQAAAVLSDAELNNALELWYAARRQADSEPLEPFATWQEQSAAMPPPDRDERAMLGAVGTAHPPRDATAALDRDDYHHPAAINRDQETT